MTYDELIEIYELTYKYQMLKVHRQRMGDWLGDQANIKYLKIKSALLNKINDGLEEMISVYDVWLEGHLGQHEFEFDSSISMTIHVAENKSLRASNVSDYSRLLDFFSENMEGITKITKKEKKDVLSEIKVALANGNKELSREIFSDFIHLVYDNINLTELASKYAMEEDDEFIDISKHKDKMEEALYGRPELDDMLTQFHIGLNIAHHNGEMAEHLLENPSEEDTLRIMKTTGFETGSFKSHFLQALSEGWMVDEWDHELARIIGKQYDPDEEDSRFIDWSKRGRTRNPGAIPAPEYHIFIKGQGD